MPGAWSPNADRDRGRSEPPWAPPLAPPPSAEPPFAPARSAPPPTGPGQAPRLAQAPFLREAGLPARRTETGAGDLTRRQGTFTGQITRDSSSGFPVEAGRYQLYASLACPWSQRALIVCRLLGLDRVIGLTLTDPVTDEGGWRLGGRDPADPLTGARHLADLYRTTDPGYPGPYTLPLIWDQRTRTVVTNDVTDITVMLETEFRQFHRPGSPDLYPLTRRRDIESLATLIHHTVNYGVYRARQATDQASYDQAVDALFTTFDALEERLAGRRFLLGSQLTETDIRLYPTLARFDAVYYQLFNCNLRRLTDYPHLWGYTRDLYSQPGFGETTDLGQIKQHYYLSDEWDNRSHIIPIGPTINWNEPHGRARLSA
ncbi:MAG: glutathione S-transferase family protein [Streptosporangiaceae bacterium]